jgi:hypothetical protein
VGLVTTARGLKAIVWAGAMTMLLVQNGVADSVGHELLQTKNGVAEYIAAIASLHVRDPEQDARRDLASGNRDLYCVGTIGCMAVGVSGDLPDGVGVHATATTGCIIMGGEVEMEYRTHEERYVEGYNRAKLAALRSRPAHSNAP